MPGQPLAASQPAIYNTSCFRDSINKLNDFTQQRGPVQGATSARWRPLRPAPEMEHDFDEEARKVFAWLNLQPVGTSRYNALGELFGWGRAKPVKACRPGAWGLRGSSKGGPVPRGPRGRASSATRRRRGLGGARAR